MDGHDLISHHFPEITTWQVEQFSEAGRQYTFWNQKINLISRKDSQNLYLRHILHSLSIAKLIRFVPCTTILDAGTGGGFPGLPLAIAFPQCSFVLADSTGKKINALQHIIASLKITNAEAIQVRVELLDRQFDFVTGRAVAPLTDFVKLVRNKIASRSKNRLSNGILYLKGNDALHEVKRMKNAGYRLYPVHEWLPYDFFLNKYLVHIMTVVPVQNR